MRCLYISENVVVDITFLLSDATRHHAGLRLPMAVVSDVSWLRRFNGQWSP